MYKVENIIAAIQTIEVIGELDKRISSIQIDSRAVEEGSLFVAINGAQVDGHKFIAGAIEKGAIVVVCEAIPAEIIAAVTYIKVENSNQALGAIANLFYGSPSAKVKLIGVTGTNGKTTIATLLYKLFMALGYPVGLLSTIENRVLDRVITSTHTTPNAIALNKLLAEMVEAQVEYVFMEVSSHAIIQERIGSVDFAGGIFTNLTHEHLDYHKTFANYRDAKKKFFDHLPTTAFALINSDDKNGAVMLQNCKARNYSYALHHAADFKGRIMENNFDGLLLTMNGKEVCCPLVGKFNASNLLAIYATAMLLGQDSDEVLLAISSISSAEGRFEVISIKGRTAIVDYAHTPDALQNVLSTINEINEGASKVITVVGCGGDRDREKRPLMAQIAADISDKVILTSDNPRTENPETILDDMEQGLDPVQKRKVLRIADRAAAIRTAVHFSLPEDIVLVAGKGHEKYQEVMNRRVHFDDREQLVNELNTL